MADAVDASDAVFRRTRLSLTVSEIFNVKCNTMVAVTLIRPLNKGH